MSNTGQSLFKMYNKDGGNFLAYRLQKLFIQIKTPADTALHNEILTEIILILDGDNRSFLEALVELILYKPVKRRERFLIKLAKSILEIGQRKVKYGKEKK